MVYLSLVPLVAHGSLVSLDRAQAARVCIRSTAWYFRIHSSNLTGLGHVLCPIGIFANFVDTDMISARGIELI